MVEWASFDWPLRDLDELRRLLQCEHIRPTILIGGEFSGAMRSYCESRGRLALTVDPRESDAGGMHYVGQVQDVADLQRWEAAVFFPPCFQQLRGDADCLPLKLSDGRAFWGIAFVWWCACLPNADVVVVEQPDTIAHDFGPQPEALLEHGMRVTEFLTSEYGDSTCKYVRITSRGAALPPRTHARRRWAEIDRGTHNYASADDRDRQRSSWLAHPRTVEQVGQALFDEGLRRPSAPLSYRRAICTVAQRFSAEHHPVPHDFDNHDARPSERAARDYQLQRGAGDSQAVRQAPVERFAGEQALSGSEGSGEQPPPPADLSTVGGSSSPPPAAAPARAGTGAGDELGDDQWTEADEASLQAARATAEYEADLVALESDEDEPALATRGSTPPGGERQPETGAEPAASIRSKARRPPRRA